MLKAIILVGTGGLIGSIGRYLVQNYCSRFAPYPFPVSTFTVNIVGSLLIGIIYGLADRQNVLSQEWRLFLATGICGGFTTFSAFAMENMTLIKQGDYATFLAYTLSSIALGLGAVVLGVYISKI